MQERLELCYPGTSHECPAAGALLARVIHREFPHPGGQGHCFLF